MGGGPGTSNGWAGKALLGILIAGVSGLVGASFMQSRVGERLATAEARISQLEIAISRPGTLPVLNQRGIEGLEKRLDAITEQNRRQERRLDSIWELLRREGLLRDGTNGVRFVGADQT